jgi:molybdopterin converting factor small subunit
VAGSLMHIKMELPAQTRDEDSNRMKIKVKVFSSKILQAMHNPDSITVEGNTVGQCLDDLIRQYPDIENLVLDKQHKQRKEISVYVNMESLHKIEFSRPVKGNDILVLAVMISGG